MGEHGRLRRSISRWASPAEAEARDLREESVSSRALSIGDAPDRVVVRLVGSLRTVTVRPHGGAPALEAELYDGTGALTLLWLGRRWIAGIGPGRSLQVEGRVGLHDGRRVMYNPRYELRP